MKSFRQWEAELPLQNDPKHMIGNPVFAIETNIMPLRKRIVEGRTQEALEILADIETSLARIKDFLAQLG